MVYCSILEVSPPTISTVTLPLLTATSCPFSSNSFASEGMPVIVTEVTFSSPAGVESGPSSFVKLRLRGIFVSSSPTDPVVVTVISFAIGKTVASTKSLADFTTSVAGVESLSVSCTFTVTLRSLMSVESLTGVIIYISGRLSISAIDILNPPLASVPILLSLISTGVLPV